MHQEIQNRQWIIPKNDPKRSMRHTHDVTRKKSQNVGWGWCWLRDVGLQINTNTTRSRAWKFLKFVFRCSVLVPNRWMWSSEHIIVGCFCISQHPLLNFLLVEETLPLWQSSGRGCKKSIGQIRPNMARNGHFGSPLRPPRVILVSAKGSKWPIPDVGYDVQPCSTSVQPIWGS